MRKLSKQEAIQLIEQHLDEIPSRREDLKSSERNLGPSLDIITKSQIEFAFDDHSEWAFKMSDLQADSLVKKARRDFLAFDTCIWLASRALEKGQHNWPRSLQLWAASVLAGEVKRPHQRGPHPEANFGRNMRVATIVYLLVRAGLSATQNNASETLSACGVVGEHLNMSYEAVRKIWDKYSHLRGY